jgi:hypothetical protein
MRPIVKLQLDYKIIDDLKSIIQNEKNTDQDKEHKLYC